MDPAALKAELSTTLASIHELDGQGVLDSDQSKRMAELLTRGEALRAQLVTHTQQQSAAGELRSWAEQSQGMVALAKPGPSDTPDGKVAVAQSLRHSGDDYISRDPRTRAIRLDEAYGEGLFDRETISVIGTDQYRTAFRDYIRTGIGKQVPTESMRTLAEGGDSTGGFLVPEDFSNIVVSRDPTPTRVQGRVTQLQTGRDALVIPKIVYTADDLYTTGIRVTWTQEIPSGPTQSRVTDPVFGSERIPIYTAMLSIPVTNDMVEDSAFPLVNYLAGKFGETIELLKDNMILNGSGVGQPSGILVNPGTADNPRVINSTQAATLTPGGLINTAMSLAEQYDTNSCWVFNKVSTGNAIANMVDTTGRPMWGLGVDDAGLQSGYLGRPLVGYPVVFSGFMPNVAANSYSAVFGDLSGYFLVNRIGFSVQVLRELYAETNQILILGRIRFGGLNVEPWKMLIHRVHT